MPAILSEHESWLDTDGTPLVAGSIYIGSFGQDPVSNTITIYSDYDYQTTLANPQLTDAYGKAENKIYVPGRYSIEVRDSAGSQVYQDLYAGNITAEDILFTQSGTGAVERTTESKFQDIISVKDFGATGDGSTDDAAAIQAAIDAVEAVGGGTVFLPQGDYVVGTTLTMDTAGVLLRGVGCGFSDTIPGPTLIRATHTSGPVIKIEKRACGVEMLDVTSDATRAAAAAGTNSGIHIEGDDVAGGAGNPQQIRLDRVNVNDQPWHGILFAGEASSSFLTQCNVDDCGGHGYCFDDGTETSRTNLARPQLTTLLECRATDCGGNALVMGNETGDTAALRVHMYNFECFRNATDAAVRRSNHQIWMFAENCEIIGSAVGGNDVSGGIRVAGRHLRVNNNRYIDTTVPVTIDEVSGTISTLDVEVQNLKISGGSSPFDPAIVVSAGTGIRARQKETTNITSLMTENVLNSEVEFSGNYAHRSYQTASSEVIADDGFAEYEFSDASSAGMAIITSSLSARGGGIVMFRVGASVFCDVVANTSGATFTATTGALNGTTGTDTHLTVSAHTDNKLYIENRTGVAGTYQVMFVGTGTGVFKI